MRYKYGYFNESGSEFTVTDPKTPRAFDNLLWNDAIFSDVWQTGVGYADYQVGDGEAIQLLTGVVVDRVEFVENFPKPRFDKILPAILLMGGQIGDGEGLVAFGEEHATTGGS